MYHSTSTELAVVGSGTDDDETTIRRHRTIFNAKSPCLSRGRAFFAPRPLRDHVHLTSPLRPSRPSAGARKSDASSQRGLQYDLSRSPVTLPAGRRASERARPKLADVAVINHPRASPPSVRTLRYARGTARESNQLRECKLPYRPLENCSHIDNNHRTVCCVRCSSPCARR